jgi:hypothetical protein
MMSRVLSLTGTPAIGPRGPDLTAKILYALHENRLQQRNFLLHRSFGGSYSLYLCAVFAYLGWTLYSGLWPAEKASFDMFSEQAQKFIPAPRWSYLMLQNWGEMMTLLLSLSLMAFVLRTHAFLKTCARPFMIVLASYAVAGLATFFAAKASSSMPSFGAFTGNGAGSSAWLLAPFDTGHAPSLFDFLLTESGLVGLAIAAFAVFVPLGTIALAAGKKHTDTLVSFCGILCGLCLILSLFLPFGSLLAAYMVLCAAGLFLAWGDSEVMPENLDNLRF